MNDINNEEDEEKASYNLCELFYRGLLNNFLTTTYLTQSIAAMRKKTFYEVLHLNRTATQREIQENYLVLKYLTLSKAYQSNLVQNDKETAKLINFAYWTLKDEERRREYDLQLKFEGTLEEASTKHNLGYSKEASNIRMKMISFISQKKLRVIFLTITVFLVYFYADVSDIDNMTNRDIIFALSILLYFISLMSVIPML